MQKKIEFVNCNSEIWLINSFVGDAIGEIKCPNKQSKPGLFVANLTNLQFHMEMLSN